MRRAGFAEETTAKRLEHAIDLREDLKAMLDGVAVVRRVSAILGEEYRLIHLLRHGPEVRSDVERAQHRRVVAEKLRDRLRA